MKKPYLQILVEAFKDSSGLNITPKVGIDKIRLGMPFNQVKSIVKNCKPFKKTSQSEHVALDCPSLNLHVFFTKDGKVNEIEAFEGSKVIYNGFDFFNNSYTKAVSFLKTNDPTTKVGRDQAQSPKLGISVWTEGNGKVDSVLVS